MTSQVGSVFVKLGADVGSFQRAMGDARASLAGVSSAATGAGSSVGRFGSQAANAAKVAGLVLGGALLGVGAAALKVGSDFEQSMSGIKAVSGASADEMTRLSNLTKQLGKDTVFSAGEAASGIEELIKGGVSITDVLNGAAKATLNLASAGGIDLASAAEIASNALAMFNLKGTDMAHVSDMIAGAANASSLSVMDFKYSLQMSGAVAKVAGQSFDSLAVAIAIMGKAGIKGQDAGTSLKQMMMSLVPTTKTAIAKFKELGIITKKGNNLFLDAKGNYKSLAEISQILQDKTKGLSQSQKVAAFQVMFGSDAIRAATILTEAGAKGFEGMADAMKKVSAAEVAKQRLDNLKGSIEQLTGSLETAGITLGEKLIPKLRPFVDWATGFVNNVADAIDTGNWGPVITSLQDGISGAWNDVKNLAVSIWDKLTLRTEQIDASGMMRTYRVNVIDEIQRWIGSIWEGVKPAAINVGELLFGKEEVSFDWRPTTQSKGLAQQVIDWINGQIDSLDAQILGNTELRANAQAAGRAVGQMIVDGLKSSGTDAANKPEGKGLVEDFIDWVAGPFVDSLIKQMLSLPPDADLGAALWEHVRKSLAYGALLSYAKNPSIGNAISRAIAALLVDPTTFKELEKSAYRENQQVAMAGVDGFCSALASPEQVQKILNAENMTIVRATGQATETARDAGNTLGSALGDSASGAVYDSQSDVYRAAQTVMTNTGTWATPSATTAGRSLGGYLDAGASAGLAANQATVNASLKGVVDNGTGYVAKYAYSDGLTIGQRISAGMAAGLSAAEARLRALRIQIDQITAYKRENGGFFASGTRSAPPGLSWVGERGPELVNFSGGERVYSAAESKAMMSRALSPGLMGGAFLGGATGGGSVINIYVSDNTMLSDDRSTARKIAEILKPELDAIVRW